MIKHLIFFRNGNVWATREHYHDMKLSELVQVRAGFDPSINPETFFSTRGRKGGDNLKEGKIEIGWKVSDKLLPSESTQFREGLTNLLRKFQAAGAEITVATFADGTAPQPVNLVEVGQHADA